MTTARKTYHLLFFLLFLFSIYAFHACNPSNAHKLPPKKQSEIKRIIDAVPQNQPDLYVKVIKDSANSRIETQKMCQYVLDLGWKFAPDAYSILVQKIDSTYGKENDTIHFYVQHYTAENYIRLMQRDSVLALRVRNLAFAQKLQDSLLLSQAYQGLGVAYTLKSRFIQALSMIQKAMDYLPNKNKSDLADLKAELPNIYMRMRDPKKAKECMYESFELAKQYKDSITIALYATHLASAYADLKLADSTLWAAQQSYNIAKNLPDSSIFSLIYYYMGVGYELKNEPDKGLLYANKALILSEKQQNAWLKSRTNLNIANCYLEKGELEKAKSLYWANLQEQRTKMGIKVNTSICDSLVVLSLEKSGDKELANYFRYVRNFMDSTFSAQKISALEEMQVRYETEKKENTIKILAAGKKMAQSQTLIALLSLLLVLGVGSWIIYRNRQKHLLLEKENALLEASKQLLEINKHLQAKVIEENKLQLSYFNENIIAKNKLIEEMEMQMVTLLRNATCIAEEELSKNKIALNAMKILTDADWKTYLVYFEKAKPQFVTQVKASFPDLTQGELRLFLLINLGFDKQQIADILGISWEGARKNQYRLKKKLGVNEDKQLESFIKNF